MRTDKSKFIRKRIKRLLKRYYRKKVETLAISKECFDVFDEEHWSKLYDSLFFPKFMRRKYNET